MRNRLFWLSTRLLFAYACWLGMMAAHEFGHVLNAWISGGRVERVIVPLFGFSRTDVSPNPRPAFVAWGGAVWGSLLPGGLALVARIVLRRPLRAPPQFFAGLCLIANGAYLGVGWIDRAGDAGDLLRKGTPAWALIAFGVVTVAAGLWIWHRLDSRTARPS